MTTMARATGCPKSALTRLPPQHPHDRRSGVHIRARQRVFCTRHQLRPAGEFSGAGDDPVNEGDPSGLSTEGYCASFSVFAAVVGGAATDCIVKTPNGDSVGITATVAVTAGFDSATLIGAESRTPCTPSKWLRLLGPADEPAQASLTL